VASRWKSYDDYSTAHWCGLAAWVFRWPEPGTVFWDDLDDRDDLQES